MISTQTASVTGAFPETSRPSCDLLETHQTMLSERDRHTLLHGFNATDADFPPEKQIHQLFEAQVALTPDATAIVHGEQVMTYAELNRQANRLARYLSKRGVGPDALVGICVERSPAMVVGLLGILKAGGAYLPLDPSYPTDRLRYMLENSSPRTVLTEVKWQEVLPAIQTDVIALDRELSWLKDVAEGDTLPVERSSRALDLVYVIYTSGSTGRPKGISMSHRAMVNLVEWHRRTFINAAGQRVLQFAALSFDVAFQETFSTLCTGGTLFLIDEWIRRDPQALTDLLIRCSIQRLCNIMGGTNNL